MPKSNGHNDHLIQWAIAVAKELGISESHAYKIMRKLNAELKEKGYLTIAGRVNRKFFMEKFCYGGTERT